MSKDKYIASNKIQLDSIESIDVLQPMNDVEAQDSNREKSLRFVRTVLKNKEHRTDGRVSSKQNISRLTAKRRSVDRHSFELNLKKTFKRFISRSSVYGVSRVLETDHKSVKLTWALLILLSSSFGVFMIAKNISEYFAYDVVTRTKTIETNGDHFPAISFCPSVFTDDTLEVKEIALDGVKLKDVKFEHVTSSGCYRFNSHNTTRGSTYLRAKNVGIYRGLRFLIQVNDPLNIYIADNHLDSFERAVQFLSDSKSTYLSIYKTNEIKKEYPFNKCQNLNATYRHLNCKQDCIYKQVANAYNCSYHGFRYFMYNTLAAEQCKNLAAPANNTKRQLLRDLTHKYLLEFGDVCEARCPVECVTMKYNNILMTMNTSEFTDQINGDKRLRVVYVYFEQFSYAETMQYAKVSEYSLVSSIGGSLSLFIGIKFLSMMEMFEVVMETAILAFRYRFTRSGQN